MAEYQIQRWTNDEWAPFAEKAHTVVFGEERPQELNTHHFVLVVICNKEIGGYFTCLQMDAETLYIQYGGAFPNFIHTKYVYPGYVKMIDWCKVNFKQVWTRVENTNKAMLKMALQAGFIVNGLSVIKGKTYLELYQEVV